MAGLESTSRAVAHSVGGRGRDREEVVAGRHNLEMVSCHWLEAGACITVCVLLAERIS